MKVLSLFDGMSCGQIALDQLGIPVEKYYASEIDKYAIKVTQANYPNTIQVGDVCNLNAEDTPALWRGVLQMQAQMECACVDWGLLEVLYQSTDFRLFVYKRDPAFATKLRTAVEDWNKRVKDENYFPFELLDEKRNDGVLVHPEATEDEVVDLDKLYEDHARQIMLCDETIKNAKASKQNAMARLMEAMGNHSKARVGDFSINWGMTHYKEKEEKVVPAKEAYSVRRKTLNIKKVLE